MSSTSMTGLMIIDHHRAALAHTNSLVRVIDVFDHFPLRTITHA